MLNENERWVLSYYRHSEIGGALFFGNLTRIFRNGVVGHNLTKHFADESQHAWLWTQCLRALDCEPLKIDKTYQEQYLEAIGMPINLMEILAITQVFERRVIHQYARHNHLPGLDPRIAATFATIMEDEKWHIQWIAAALADLSLEYGRDHVDATVKRYRQADQEIYAKTVAEHEERLEDLFRAQP